MKYEKWSPGYWCLKQYIRFVDWLIYNKTIVTGKNHIPRNKPILFAPNHQNALSDPMAVLLNTRFQPVWLARADIFKKGFVTRALRFLKIMPVYRLRDGKENLAKNDETFENSVKILANNFALALFPEAAHSGKRQMLSHKKAVPRIVFMAEEMSNENLDIQIIPTGIYYSHYWKFDRNLIVNFGEPIAVNPFFEQYKENPNAATLSLRTEIRKRLEPLVIDIKSKTFYKEFEKIRSYYGEHFLRRQNKKLSLLNLFYSNQELVAQLDKLEEEQPETIQKLAGQINHYHSQIKKLKLRGWLIEKSKFNGLNVLKNILILLLTFPVFAYGFLFNALPFFTVDLIARKKIKNKEFWSTFFLGLGIIVFPVLYLAEFFAVAWVIPFAWLKLLFLVSLPFAGKLAFKWYIFLRKTIGRIHLLRHNIFNKNAINLVFAEKEKIFRQLDKIIHTD